MDFKKRFECWSKIVNMINEGESVVVCGTGFFYNVFKEFLLGETLEKLDGCIIQLDYDDPFTIEFDTGARIIIFDVEKSEELDAFVERGDEYPVNLMLLFEPQLGFLKEQYNTKLLPIILTKPSCRIQIVRGG